MGSMSEKFSTLNIWSCALMWAAAMPAAAQVVNSDWALEDADKGHGASYYALPDLSTKALESINVVKPQDHFSIKFSFAILPADYTWFSQNAASVAQVGVQQDQYQVRSLRGSAYGYFELWRHWNYLVSYEYDGFGRDPGTDIWQLTDAKLSTYFEGFATLTFGKIKEPYVYEMVGDSANLPQSERLMSPFFKSRNIGFTLSNTMFDQRATWAIGAYDNWLTTAAQLKDAGEDVVARLTVLPVWAEKGADYLHLGASVRYVGGTNDILSFSGKPASNVTSNYVSTGNMNSNHAWNTGFEALGNVGPWSVLAEYDTSSVRSASLGNPKFSGYYAEVSWIITGEHRPYDQKAAYARRVQPQGRWGAWEVMARYGRVDLNDAQVHGGTMHGWWTALNWWATRRWKFSLQYGDIDLLRAPQTGNPVYFGTTPITGNTKELLSRMQWIY
jgi:phosphate-selective porin